MQGKVGEPVVPPAWRDVDPVGPPVHGVIPVAPRYGQQPLIPRVGPLEPRHVPPPQWPILKVLDEIILAGVKRALNDDKDREKQAEGLFKSVWDSRTNPAKK